MSNLPLTDAQLEAVAYYVRNLIRKESKGVAEVELVNTLDGIESFPTILNVGGITKVVRAPIELLSAPAWAAVRELLDELNVSIESVETAVGSANNATESTTKVINDAISATESSESQRKLCVSATNRAVSGAIRAEEAGEFAQTSGAFANDKAEIFEELIIKGDEQIKKMDALEKNITNYVQMTPTRIELSYLERITFGNPAEQYVKAKLYPAYIAQNVLYLPAGGDDVVTVSPDGKLSINKIGKVKVHVIPTANVSLYTTIEIEITRPVIRLSGTGKIKVSSNGKIRIT